MATFEIFTDTKGEYRWHLKAGNGRIMADSAEGYVNKSDCQAGIAFVKANAASANVVDLTVSKTSSYGYGTYYR